MLAGATTRRDYHLATVLQAEGLPPRPAAPRPIAIRRGGLRRFVCCGGRRLDADQSRLDRVARALHGEQRFGFTIQVSHADAHVTTSIVNPTSGCGFRVQGALQDAIQNAPTRAIR